MVCICLIVANGAVRILDTIFVSTNANFPFELARIQFAGEKKALEKNDQRKFVLKFPRTSSGSRAESNKYKTPKYRKRVNRNVCNQKIAKRNPNSAVSRNAILPNGKKTKHNRVQLIVEMRLVILEIMCLRFVWKFYAVMLDKQNDCSSLRWHERLIIVKYLSEKKTHILSFADFSLWFFFRICVHSQQITHNVHQFSNTNSLFIDDIFYVARKKNRQQTTSNLLMIHDVIIFLMGDIRFKWIWRFSSYQCGQKKKHICWFSYINLNEWDTCG